MKRHLNCQCENQACLYRTLLYFTGAIMALVFVCRIDAGTLSSSLTGFMPQYEVDYSGESPVSAGKPADSNSLQLDDSPEITVTFVPMNKYPENPLNPVESQTQMITVLPASSALAAVSRLLRGARAGIIHDPTQILEPAVRDPGVLFPRQTLRGILPFDVGVNFHIMDRLAADAETVRKLEIRIRRKPDREPNSMELTPTGISLEIALVATGQPKEAAVLYAGSSAISGKEQERSMPAVSGMLTTETILLKPLDLQEEDRLGILLPSPFDMGQITVFSVLIEVKAPPQEGTADVIAYAELLRECQDALQRTDKQEKLQFDTGRRGIEDAIGLLLWPTYRRQALLYLAKEAPAPIIEDIVLSASDIVIDHLSDAIIGECMSGSCFEADSLQWRLHQITYQLLAELMSADQKWPQLEAVVMRYTGQVGRHPAVLKEMTSEAASVTDLQQRLLLENFIYLEDISPSARTRAFEWLAARGQAPEGYDPLASLEERRNALNRSQQEQQ